MPTINMTIVRRNDPAPWPDVGQVVTVDPEQPIQVAALEGGMDSGAPSVALRIDLDDDTTVIAETSLAVWITATCAMRGAFPEAFAGTPLDDGRRGGDGASAAAGAPAGGDGLVIVTPEEFLAMKVRDSRTEDPN